MLAVLAANYYAQSTFTIYIYRIQFFESNSDMKFILLTIYFNHVYRKCFLLGLFLSNYKVPDVRRLQVE